MLRLLPPTSPSDDTSARQVSDDELRELYAWPDRAWLRSNMVMSLDGAARSARSDSAGLSSSTDKHVFALLRSTCDVIIVGSGTVRTEDYQPLRFAPELQASRVAAGQTSIPTFVVVSGRLNLSPDAPIFGSEEGTVLVATTGAADPSRRSALEQVAEVVEIGEDSITAASVVELLDRRGWRRRLTEGGPSLLGTLATAIDEYCVSISPQVVGAAAEQLLAPAMIDGVRLPHQIPLQLAHLLVADSMLIGSWRRTSSP